MSNDLKDSIAIAEKLLELVKLASAPDVSPLTAWNTKIKIQSACDLLLANVLGPLEYTVLIAESCHESAALYFVATLGIADLIGAGDSTLTQLSMKSGVDSQYLGVVMSCLLGHGYFEEVGGFGTRVYKNNALSDVLREGNASLKNAIGFIGDEAFRAASRLLDAAKTTAPVEAAKPQRVPAVNIAFGFSGSPFEWMSRPDEAWRGKRLGKAMQELHRLPNSNVPEDYPWHELPSPIVDVGGGIGTLEMSILKNEQNHHLEFVLFDIPETIRNAKEVWSSQPVEISSRVSFVGGNFMASSLVDANIPQGQPTYIIKHVLHDWTDSEVVHILNTVRQAMPRHNSRLLLVEMLLRSDSSRFVRTTSMQILALNNGFTRTQEEMEVLVRRAGLRVAKVIRMTPSIDTVIEVVVA